MVTEFPCHDKAWVGVAEARDDRVPLACDRMHDARVYCAHDILDSVHGVCVHYLSYCSWALFTYTIHGHCSKKKSKISIPGNWGVTKGVFSKDTSNVN